MPKYTFSYENPNTHFLNIRFELEKPNKEATRLYIPAWRPGRYQMADFARYVQQWYPYDGKGKPLSFQKVAKDCWEINTSSIDHLVVEYNYFAFKLDAGNTYLDDDQLFINPVNCCLYDQDRMDEACQVFLDLPEGYEVATAMTRAGKNTFQARDFQELADSPLIASDGIDHETLEVDDYRFHLWFKGECDPDYERIKADFTAFIQTQIQAFGEFPANNYHFFYQLPSYNFFHGVEHQNSTVIALGPGFKLMQTDLYQSFLAVSSHELYHTWNIKAIRPVEMTPYRFNEENYTNLGYMAEGVTSYFGDLFLLRSQVFDFVQYQEQFNKFAIRHFHNYGRHFASVTESSFDTWLDGYDHEVPNRKVSIYVKGMLIAFLLDIQIMHDTNNHYSLDEVMRRLYFHFAKKQEGYSEEALKGIIEAVTEKTYDAFFKQYIWGKESLEEPVKNALDYLGLALNLIDPDKYWEKQFGIKVKEENNDLKISQIAPGSPAEEAGLSIEDELVAINGIKIDRNLEDLFAYHYEETIQLTIFRNNHIKQMHLIADGSQFFPNVNLDEQCNPSKNQKANFKAWAWIDLPKEG